MAIYNKTNSEVWTGRKSGQKLYLHEKIECVDFEDLKLNPSQKTIALLGYACDEGVERNQGRVGAAEGPNAIRKQLAKMPNHLATEIRLIDVGTIQCLDGDMETAQNNLSQKVSQLLGNNAFTIVMGGGHDLAYGHYDGIKNYVGKHSSVGSINFDAHFDLRNNGKGNHSGTPFYQIALNSKSEGNPFEYLCLGIRKDANDTLLFQTAEDFGVGYVERESFNIGNWDNIEKNLRNFINEVDHIYATIDLDGFSSAFAPGVSAPSPMGFSPDVVLECLKVIVDSRKLISLDIAEMNPTYDIDNHTAKLAASLVHFGMHKWGAVPNLSK